MNDKLSMIEEKHWSPPLTERLRVWWTNWRNRGTGKAYRGLCKAMQDDPSYAHSWFCNISMPIYDNSKGKLTVSECNDIADRLMRHLFSVENSSEPDGRNQKPRQAKPDGAVL